MNERIRIVTGVCELYEKNGECHALPYEPGVGFVSDPTLAETGTGGKNFGTNRDVWCKARHGNTDWKQKEVSTKLATAQTRCSRYEKGWPRTEGGKSLYNERGEWVIDIDKDGNWITDEVIERLRNSYKP
jgi:hypothetical protein